MGQKVNPHGLRVGVIKNWDSRWYVNAKEMGDTIVSDYKIREYVKTKLQSAGVPKVVGFPRQEYWSGLPFPPPGDLPNPGIEPVSPVSPARAGGFFTTEIHLGSPLFLSTFGIII